jgi:hypothetical protein
MSRWMILPAFVLAWMVAPGSANEAAPPRPQPKTATAAVVVVVDDKAEAVRVQVPKKLLSQLQAAAPGEGSSWAGVPRFHLMATGICLSLALGCGGFWLMRRSEKSAVRGLLMLLAAIVLLSLSAAVAWANAAVPFKPATPPLPPGIPLAEKATIEIVEQGEAITLIVPRQNLAKVLEKSP